MKRPPALIAIVIYKGFMAVLLAITALAIIFLGRTTLNFMNLPTRLVWLASVELSTGW
jgi:hypothetical protein